MKKRHWLFAVLAVPVLIGLAVLLYQIPFLQNRLSWRIDDIKTRLIYALNPPDEAVFVPLGTPTPSTLEPLSTPPTPDPTEDPVISTQILEEELPTPTVEDVELPEKVVLDGVLYVDQHERWNYCGPVNLAMALNFWGWQGDRDDIARVIKPGVKDSDLDFIQRGRTDKNVMPSEMIDFVVEETNFNILVRHGGNLQLIKKLIASGYPVLVEKGVYQEDYRGDLGWMGHYLFTTGYDDEQGEFIVQNSNPPENVNGKNMRVDYQTYLEGWRSFNYLLIVVYPPDRQSEILELIGPWQDPDWTYHHALDRAEAEIETLGGVDRFFAWFNKGTNLVKLERYLEAAEAYDNAFQQYEKLVDSDGVRPYRITWYQTWPYMAYYYSGRYQDVINLAKFTLETIAEPTLEETLYWRGLAYYALGDTAQAKRDLYQSVYLNPNFDAGWIQIARLGL